MKVDSSAPVAAKGSEKGVPEARGSKSPAGLLGRGYREDQGRLARMAGFWACVLLLLFGCTFLHGMLIQIDALQEKVGGIRIPVVGVDLTGAFLIALGVFLLGTIIVQRWQSQPKVADLLIETEAELRKVTWPTGQEVLNSSMVVILCVTLLFAFLAAADWFLARVMRYLLLGEV